MRLDRSAGSRVGDGVGVQPPSLPHSRRFDPRLVAEGGSDRLGPVRGEPDLGPVVQDQTVRPPRASFQPRTTPDTVSCGRTPGDPRPIKMVSAPASSAPSTLLPRTYVTLASMALMLAAEAKAVCRSADSGPKRWRAKEASLGIFTSDDSRRRYSPRCRTSPAVGFEKRHEPEERPGRIPFLTPTVLRRPSRSCFFREPRPLPACSGSAPRIRAPLPRCSRCS